MSFMCINFGRHYSEVVNQSKFSISLRELKLSFCFPLAMANKKPIIDPSSATIANALNQKLEHPLLIQGETLQCLKASISDFFPIF